MNIYLISQDTNNGYDTYDSAIVTAENEDVARLIHPDPDLEEYKYKSMYWVDDPKLVTVKLLGTLDPDMPQKTSVLLASFNAG
ncbi:MAG: hypothetical protein COA71_14755 [SAR86 cluster bacterium]|uniref:Uncharacterized protein n=1 Tax=SAR86 cluster bacterium TaxID=2030880 RepID=A0A2A5C690_9GAMM|nr:MAG: hypothetical protein COA71_14755 [SAR86 cluster bacterium]